MHFTTSGPFIDFNDAIRSFYISLTRHFWNREWPKTIRSGEGVTRDVHGANTTVLVYDQGLRTAWYPLKAGMYINIDPVDQVNEFDTAIIVTRGRFGGKIDGVERVFREGETVLIPAEKQTDRLTVGGRQAANLKKHR